MIRKANRTVRLARTGKPCRRKQEGFTLVELALVTALLSIAAIWQGSQFIQEVNDVAAEATGTYLHAVKGAVDNMVAENFSDLSTHTSTVPGYVSALAPTLAELRAKGHLLPTFPDTTPFGQSVAVRIQVSATCPGPGCRIDGLTYTTTPLRVQSIEPREDLIARAVMATAGYGGASYGNAPGVIRGATFSVPNPVTSTPGIIGVVSNMDTSMFNQFVRIRDTRDPELQGSLSVKGFINTNSMITVSNNAGQPCVSAANNGHLQVGCQGLIEGATGTFRSNTSSASVSIAPDTGVNASERIYARKGLSTDLGAIFDANEGAVVRSNSDSMALRTSSGQALSLQQQDVVAAKSMSSEVLKLRTVVYAGSACTNDSGVQFARDISGGLLACHPSMNRWVQLSKIATAGEMCSPNGSFANSYTGQGLVCRLGVYMDANDLFPSYVLVDTQLVSHFSQVVKPTCASMSPGVNGTPLIYLIPSKESSKASSFTRQASDGGSVWSIYLYDYDGTPLGGQAQALAHIYCKY